MSPQALRLLAARYRQIAADLDFQAAVIDANASLQRLNDTLRRIAEAEFLEIVVRYDEGSGDDEAEVRTDS